MRQQLIKELSRITPEERRLIDGGAIVREEYTHAADFVVDAAQLLQAGKMISVRAHTRFVDFPPHSHNYVELIYMASGHTLHLINGRYELELKPGELLFLNQHATHSIRRAEEDDIAINFIVLPTFFDTALEMIGSDNVLGQFLMGSLHGSASTVSYLHFSVADILPVQNLMENMVWSIVSDQPNHRRINQVSMGLLFLQLLNYTQRMEISPVSGSNHALVVEALREIEENYRQANFTALAKRYNVSLAYISRLVKNAAGHSCKTLLRTKRLSKAAQLLTGSSLTVAEIIMAVGYENTSYFFRIFREQYGMSPQRYRESMPKMVK